MYRGEIWKGSDELELNTLKELRYHYQLDVVGEGYLNEKLPDKKTDRRFSYSGNGKLNYKSAQTIEAQAIMKINQSDQSLSVPSQLLQSQQFLKLLCYSILAAFLEACLLKVLVKLFNVKL